MYRATIRCDGIVHDLEGGLIDCDASISSDALSRELASTHVQAGARANGWLVARDRLMPGNLDLCPAHANRGKR